MCERVPSCAKDQAAPALDRAAPRDLERSKVRAANCASLKIRGPMLQPLSSRPYFLGSERRNEVVLPAPRRRRAAGRERQDLPRYVLFIAHLQSSSQGQGFAGGRRTATAVTAASAGLKDRASIATDLSPHSGRWQANMAKAPAEHHHALSMSIDSVRSVITHSKFMLRY